MGPPQLMRHEHQQPPIRDTLLTRLWQVSCLHYLIEYPANTYSQPQPYYGGGNPYDQYSQPPKMDFSQYQQEVRAQPQMYPRYPTSSYPSSYYEPRGYPSEMRSYDPTQPQHNPYMIAPTSEQQAYPPMGYGKEQGEAPKVSAATFNYAKGFQPQPIYSGFYSEAPGQYAGSLSQIMVLGGPSAGGVGEPTSEANTLMMPQPGYQMAGEKKEYKDEPYTSSAFSQPLGLSFFPPPKSEEGEGSDARRMLSCLYFIAYGGGASYKSY